MLVAFSERAGLGLSYQVNIIIYLAALLRKVARTELKWTLSGVLGDCTRVQYLNDRGDFRWPTPSLTPPHPHPPLRFFISVRACLSFCASVSVSLRDVLQATAQGLVLPNSWNTVHNTLCLSLTVSLQSAREEEYKRSIKRSCAEEEQEEEQGIHRGWRCQ